jgi:hypothetical protein
VTLVISMSFGLLIPIHAPIINSIATSSLTPIRFAH